jgi:hypothetical protein
MNRTMEKKTIGQSKSKYVTSRSGASLCPFKGTANFCKRRKDYLLFAFGLSAKLMPKALELLYLDRSHGSADGLKKLEAILLLKQNVSN